MQQVLLATVQKMSVLVCHCNTRVSLDPVELQLKSLYQWRLVATSIHIHAFVLNTKLYFTGRKPQQISYFSL